MFETSSGSGLRMASRLRLADLGWREDRHPDRNETIPAGRSVAGLGLLFAATLLLGLGLNAWFGTTSPRHYAAAAGGSALHAAPRAPRAGHRAPRAGHRTQQQE